MKANDITNKKFNYLTAIKRDFEYKNVDGHYIKWIFLCDCGEIKSMFKSRVVSGKAVSCGCKTSEIISISNKKRLLPFGQVAINRVFESYKYNSVKRNLIFELTRESFIKITAKNCFYCDDPPSNLCKAPNTKDQGDFTYSGIDRVDNSIGYIESNCIPCCKICNFGKNNMSLAEFTAWINKIVRNKSIRIS